MHSLSKKFSRLKEKTTQLFSPSDLSLPMDLVAELNEAVTIKRCLEELISVATAYFSTFSHKHGSSLTLAKFGECLRAESVFYQNAQVEQLSQIGEQQRMLSEAQTHFSLELRSGIGNQLEELGKTLKMFDQAHQKVKNYKLDYDAASKRKDNETATKIAQERYEGSITNIRNVLSILWDREKKVRAQWHHFAEAQRNFFSKCLSITQGTKPQPAATVPKDPIVVEPSLAAVEWEELSMNRLSPDTPPAGVPLPEALCGRCGCVEYTEHLFQRSVCRNCFHKH